MSIVICPGIHTPDLTQNFISGLSEELAIHTQLAQNCLVFPADVYPAYSSPHILKFLHQQLSSRNSANRSPGKWTDTSLVLIGFSAGVVGAIATALAWQQLGGQVKALIAIDGWGVPLVGNFPIHRISHDYFTHWSSALLGRGEDSFYADPSVEHLDLWRSPQTAQGWWVTATASQPATSTTAANFLTALLRHYNEL